MRVLQQTSGGIRDARRSSGYRGLLLAGTSVLALLTILANVQEARAADILRGNAAAAPVTAATAAQQAATAQSIATAIHARNSLSVATQALQALQAAQTAATNLAIASPSNVPNGLVVGGLEPDSGAPSTGSVPASWQNVSGLSQGTAGGQTTVTIDQSGQQALLNWKTFNVGKNTTVQFNQGGNSDWIAINKVNDPTALPSQILGQIKADGQVYLINPNGIIFGGSSQVNVNTLVASALPINDALVSAGSLYSNLDTQFTFSAYSQPGGTQGPTDAFTPLAATTNSQDSAVVVQAGAVISTPASAVHTGGRVILIGPEVTNSGSISTPDGQTILAAGQQVALMPHPSSDPTLRGFDVYVGETLAPAIGTNSSASAEQTGTVTNTGIIEADRGNITLAGPVITQAGGLVSTTSVALNGSILLQAASGAVGQTADSVTGPFNPGTPGNATLATGSLMEILPQLSDTDTVVGNQLALNSSVNVIGNTIYDDGLIEAPSAAVTFGNGWPNFPAITASNIYLDYHAVIDVSGSEDVQASASENVVAVQLLGAELADSPLQQNGPLRGQTVYVDLRNSGTNQDGSTWVGTPFADASGYIALVQHTVGELTIAGGTIDLNSRGAVSVQKGALLNVAGGWIDYQGATVPVTRLLSGGHLYDISQASPDINYSGIAGSYTATHSTWGLSDTFGGALVNGKTYDEAYQQGGAGGALSLRAPALQLNGTVFGDTLAGDYQRIIPPATSSLALAFVGTGASGINAQYAATTPNVVLADTGSTPTPPFDPNAPADPPTDFYLSPEQISENGFGSVAIDSTNGKISVLSAVTLPPQGHLSLTGANLDIEAPITVPGGTVVLSAVDVDPNVGPPQSALFESIDDRGSLTLGSGAAINVAGLVVDDRRGASDANALPIVFGGGTVTLSGFFLDLELGSSIDVSGGLAIAGNGKETFGNAGTISLTGGVDSNFAPDVAGLFNLDATLTGYGVGDSGQGGTLNISAPAIEIGGRRADDARPGSLEFSAAFFNQGGFQNFSLKGQGGQPLESGGNAAGIEIADNTVVQPEIWSYQPQVGVPGDVSLAPVLFSSVLRAPVSINLAATGLSFGGNFLVRGSAVVGEGATVLVDATSRGTGAIAVQGNTVAVLGTLSAPGGSISLSTTGQVFGDTSVSLDLGSDSIVSAAGTEVANIDSIGRPLGEVLPGGTITLAGNILEEHGALVDVSGATGTENVPTGAVGLGTNPYSAQRVDSDGGTITIQGNELFYIAGDLLGAAGGIQALGGTLSVSSGSNSGQGTPNLVVTGDLPSGVTFDSGLDAIGENVVVEGSALGTGQFAASTFTNGGFDSLDLKGLVAFSGPVTISARNSLTVGDGGLLTADDSVNLSAPYVMLGQAFTAPRPAPQAILAPQITVQSASGPVIYTVGPSSGAGNLTINAGDLLDIGTVALQGIGATDLSATNDVRGDGTFEAAGAVTVTAGQVYPVTDTVFTLAVLDPANTQGSLAIRSVGAKPPPLPLSAGGTLNLYASTITQDGVVRAPIGTINLGSTTPVSAFDPRNGATAQTFDPASTISLGAGSITSVSAVDPANSGVGLTIPFGTELNDLNWIDPSGTDITSGGVPAKAINIAGATVDIGSGATIDLTGGGDLYAYSWVKGIGGSNDILATSTSFAIIPGYTSNFAPSVQIIKQNPDNSTVSETGWSNANLAVGDEISLGTSTNGLPAGDYTLLPARYALLPGAYLITPQKGTVVQGSVANPDGSSIVSGYRYNVDDTPQVLAPLASLFEVDSSKVVRARAEYDDFSANTTLKAGAIAADQPAPRLPIDAGQLALSATLAMTINGTTTMSAPSGGVGGIVSISTPDNVIINDTGTGTESGTLYLSAAGLTNFGAESLLIGGASADGKTLTIVTPNIELANDSEAPLTGPDITLVALNNLTVDAAADLQSQGSLAAGANAFTIGNQSIAGSGNGVVARVSSDPTATVVRSDKSVTLGGGLANLQVGASATISGTAVILDSTNQASFDPSALVTGQALAFGAGRISLEFDKDAVLQPGAGLVLPATVLAAAQSADGSLSLTSYSSIDIYGQGSVGSPDLASLTLHAGGIRGFGTDGTRVLFAAKSITLDNSTGAQDVTAVDGVDNVPVGAIGFSGATIDLGVNDFAIVGYQSATFSAAGGLLFSGTGTFSTAGDLAVTSPVIRGAAGASQSIAAAGVLMLQPSGDAQATIDGGLGASLVLTGASIIDTTDIAMPSGNITLHATGSGGIALGVGGVLDAGGAAVSNFDQTQYSSGGVVSLTADQGSVSLGSGSVVSVAAPSPAGNAGLISVSAPAGTFQAAGQLLGVAGAGGVGGSFSLDVGGLAGDTNGNQSLARLDGLLNDSGFDDARAYRIRTGNVLVDGSAISSSYGVSADSGAIAVTGSVNASGVTGGTIDLYAYEGVTLVSGARLSVAGAQFDDAGKGGLVDIETGEAKLVGGVMTPGTGWIDLQAGATIDLSVNGSEGGILHLRAPQISGVDASGAAVPIAVNSVAGATGLAIKPLGATIINPASVVIEGFAVFDLTASGGVIDATAENNVALNAQNFAANTGAVGVAGSIVDDLLTGTGNAGLLSRLHVQPGEEIVSLASLPLTLDAAGATVSVPAGSGLNFAAGTASGDTISFNNSGTITSAAGSVTQFSAGQILTLDPGSTVSLSGAATMTLASGTTPLTFNLKASGAGQISGRTTLNAGNGTGLALQNSGSSLTLPANTTITFQGGLPSGDIISASSPTTYTTTVDGSLVTLATPGGSIILGAATAVTLPQGDSITTSGAFTTIANGAAVTLAGGKSVSLPAGVSLSIAIPAGSSLTNNIGGAVVNAGSGGASVTLNSAFQSSVTVKDATTQLSFPNGTPTGSTVFVTVRATLTDSAGHTSTLNVNSPVSLAPGSTISFAGSTTGGALTFASGSTPVAVSLPGGSYSLSNNTSIISLGTGSTFATGTGSGTLVAKAGSPAVNLTLPAGLYATTGVITQLPTGTSFASGTLTLAGGSAALPVVLPASTFTVGSGVAVSTLTDGATAKMATAGAVDFLSGKNPISLSLGAGTYVAEGTSNLNLVSDLTLNSDWNLNTYRYGPSVTSVLGSGEPGVLTLRSPGNLVFNGSLTDGFGLPPIDPSTNAAAPWEASLLPPGSQSWSYRLTAGADLSGVDFRDVVASTGSGSLMLGKPGAGVNNSATQPSSALLQNEYQVIRTGTGDIDITAARDVQFLNQFATIYTAGSQVTTSTPTTISPGGSVKLSANTPALLPSGTPAGDTIVTTANGFANLPVLVTRGSTIPTFLPQTQLSFVNGSSATLNTGSAQVQLTTPAASVLTLGANSGRATLAVMAATTLQVTAAAGSTTLVASVPVKITVGTVTKTVPAGTPFTNVTGGTTIYMSGAGTLVQTGTSAVTLQLPAGSYTATAHDTPSSAGIYNDIQFGALAPGSTLNLVGGGKVQASLPSGGSVAFNASTPIVANTPTTIMAGSSITLDGNGSLALAAGAAPLTINLPLTDGNSAYSFDTPNTAFVNSATNTLGSTIGPAYPAQFASNGGNVSITAGEDIIHLSNGADDSTQELPSNWLYHRDNLQGGVFAPTNNLDRGSTAWWVDYSNFFEGVGALGGGNVTLHAGRDVKNVDAVAPTDAWSPYQTTTITASGSVVDNNAADQPLFEYGGGDVSVTAGRDINAGVYYVEKGQGTLSAGGDITTNATRTALGLLNTGQLNLSNDPNTWLPTTLFLGQGDFNVSANGDVLLGPVANPFLLPAGENNGYGDRSYFSTYGSDDTVSVSSLGGDVDLRSATASAGSLTTWITNVQGYVSNSNNHSVSTVRPWLRLTDASASGAVYGSLVGLMPATLKVTAFSGDINPLGNFTLAPSATGTVNLEAAGSINGYQAAGFITLSGQSLQSYASAKFNLSDANPSSVPDPGNPLVPAGPDGTPLQLATAAQLTAALTSFNQLFAESGSTTGVYANTAIKDALHTPGLLHLNDPAPIYFYAGTGDVADLTLLAGKPARILAGQDILDIALYLQNNTPDDTTIVQAGRDIVAYDLNSPDRQTQLQAVNASNLPSNFVAAVLSAPLSGDISVGGPGTIEVLAGRNLNLGVGAANTDGTGVGLVSIGNARDPYLPSDQGATIIAAGGLSAMPGSGLAGSGLDVDVFASKFLNPSTAGDEATRYLPDLAELMGLKGESNGQVWTTFQSLTPEQKAKLALDVFYLVLRDAGRDHNDPTSAGFGVYFEGFQAIDALFPATTYAGDISLTSREIKTSTGGDIDILDPGGQLLVGFDLGDKQSLDQGILTLQGGNVSIFTKGNVTVGTSRIFTFEGGNEIIWSSLGNIAAGSAAKTLQSAPPTRFLIDPTTGAPLLDLAGLATGGGIGTLQTLPNVPPADVDLIAPNGFVDAGDAGIRVSGNINIAAVAVLNAGNITFGGTATGLPVFVAPNIGALAAASNASGAATRAATSAPPAPPAQFPSVFTVEVIGYGGADADTEDQRRRRNAPQAN